MKRVKDHRFLFRRGDLLYFRRKVPDHSVSAFGGRREVQKSLGTGSLSEARHRLVLELAKFEALVASTTGRAVSDAVRQIAPSRLPTKVEIEGYVRAWLLQRVARAEESGSVQDETGQARLALYELREHTRDVENGLPLETDQSAVTTTWVAEAIAEQAGWNIEQGSSLWNHLLRMARRGQIEANSWLSQDIMGEPRVIADARFAPDQYRLDAERVRDRKTANSVSLLGLLDAYISEAALAPATDKKWRRQVNAFTIFLGHDDASRVVQADVVGWKERLLNHPNGEGTTLSSRTVRDTYLAVLKAVFRWATSNGKIERDPTVGVQVAGKRKPLPRDRGLTDAEAELILKGSLLPPPKKLSAESTLARRWVPWICAYTGARVNEITQLRAEDFIRSGNIWTILITPEAGGVKDGKSRTVALHPHLIEQGLLAVIAGKKGAIFYDPVRHRGGKAGNPQYKKAGEHLARWVRALGVTDMDVWPNHGWRHRFKTQSRIVGMDREIRDAIQGHAPRTEGEAYGTVPPEVSLREIEKLPRYLWVD